MTNSPRAGGGAAYNNILASYAAAADAAAAPKPVLRGKDNDFDIYVGGKDGLHHGRTGGL